MDVKPWVVDITTELVGATGMNVVEFYGYYMKQTPNPKSNPWEILMSSYVIFETQTSKTESDPLTRPPQSLTINNLNNSLSHCVNSCLVCLESALVSMPLTALAASSGSSSLLCR